ncbi:unnamed protein product [Prunus armeniaca]
MQGWGIADMNIAGMKAGMGEKSLTGIGMGMPYPTPIRPIAISMPPMPVLAELGLDREKMGMKRPFFI